ncbi:hypothetical protein ES703_125971 [subsurface metagenome]
MKRKITLLVLLSTGIILGYLSFIAWSVGFLLVKYLGSKTVGEPSKVRSYFIPLGKYKIHLHHWLLSSCVIIGFVVFKGAYVLPSNLVYGFFGAIVFHGIYSYSDWYKVLIPRHVQSLVVAKNLMIEKITFVTHLLEMKQELEEDQTSPRSYPLSSHYSISKIGDSGSTQDKGLHKNMV